MIFDDFLTLSSQLDNLTSNYDEFFTGSLPTAVAAEKMDVDAQLATLAALVSVMNTAKTELHNHFSHVPTPSLVEQQGFWAVYYNVLLATKNGFILAIGTLITHAGNQGPLLNNMLIQRQQVETQASVRSEGDPLWPQLGSGSFPLLSGSMPREEQAAMMA